MASEQHISKGTVAEVRLQMVICGLGTALTPMSLRPSLENAR